MKLRTSRIRENPSPRPRSLDVLSQPTVTQQEGFDPRVEVAPELRAAWFKGLSEDLWGLHYPAAKAAEFLLLFPDTPPEQRQKLWNKFVAYLQGRFVAPVNIKLAQLLFPEHQAEITTISKSGGLNIPEDLEGENFNALFNLILVLQSKQQNGKNINSLRRGLRKHLSHWREEWKNPPPGATRDPSFFQLLAWLKMSDPALFSELKPDEDEIKDLKQLFNDRKGVLLGRDATYSISNAFALHIFLSEDPCLVGGRLQTKSKPPPPASPLPERPQV